MNTMDTMDTVDAMAETLVRGYPGPGRIPPVRPSGAAVASVGSVFGAMPVAPPVSPATPSAATAGQPHYPMLFPGPAGPSAPPASGTWHPVAALPGAGAPRRKSPIARWKQRNAGKYWWKVLLLGLAAYFEAMLLVTFDGNPNFVPLIMLLASAIAPITFVIYCWERGAPSRTPATVVGIALASGALLGLLAAGLLEDFLVLPIPIVAQLSVGVIEEGVKALCVVAVIWFLRDQRLRGELHGLVLGAAAGMGFDALENAGYGFTSFVGGYTDSLAHSSSLANAFGAGILWMTSNLILRAATDVFTHGAWTAIVCAAIWRGGGTSRMRTVWGVALAFAIAVVLHAAWDLGAFDSLPMLLGYYVVLGAVGLWILRFFIREGVDRAMLGVAAPPPAPLLRALATYLLHPWRRPLAEMPPASAELVSGGLAPMPPGVPGAASASAAHVSPLSVASWFPPAVGA